MSLGSSRVFLKVEKLYHHALFFLFMFLANQWFIFRNFLLCCPSQRSAQSQVPSQVAIHEESGSQLWAGETPDSNPGLQDNSLAHYHWATLPPSLSHHASCFFVLCVSNVYFSVDQTLPSYGTRQRDRITLQENFLNVYKFLSLSMLQSKTKEQPFKSLTGLSGLTIKAFKSGLTPDPTCLRCEAPETMEHLYIPYVATTQLWALTLSLSMFAAAPSSRINA